MSGFLRCERGADGGHVLRLEGVIVSDEWGWWYENPVTPSTFREQLMGLNGEPLTLVIDSPGGDVHAGSSIYTTLMEYPGEITVKVIGQASSYGSVIAMVGKRVLMSPTAMMMIHNPYVSYAGGDYRDLASVQHELVVARDAILQPYQQKTGKTTEELIALLDAETYMSAQEAVDMGFADEVMTFESEDVPAPASLATAAGQLRQMFAMVRRQTAAIVQAHRPTPPPPLPPDDLQAAAELARARELLALEVELAVLSTTT